MKNILLFSIFISISLSGFSQTFTWSTSMAIPDSGPQTCQSKTVSGLGSNLDCSPFGLEEVCIRINHTWDSDLDIYLIAPDGTIVELSTDNGGSGNDYGSGGTGTCFSMSAGTNITAGSAPFTSGPYVPEGDLATVNNGQNGNGTWQICITDDAGGDTGTLLGWSLTFGNSAPCPAAPSSQDCAGGTTVCNSQQFSGNASGEGVEELTATNRGCFSSTGEHNSSWYFFETSAAGSLAFTISPQNGTDDYDFAVWGPYASGSTPAGICPPNAAPLRCSWAAGGGNTGLLNGSGDNTEGSGGDKWVEDINAGIGEVYILLVDNFSTAGSPFDLNWNLTAGASLDCTPLPITLIHFAGKAHEDFNELTWKTASEVNNDYFLIQRSPDGNNFTDIGTVEGNGNTNSITEYSYLDEFASLGTSYYRLKQFDYNGEFEYSNIIAINSYKEIDIAIYPNPSKNNLFFDISEDFNTIYTIIYTNVLGSINKEKINISEGNNTYQANKFNQLPQGVYFIQILNENDKVIKSQKIIKE
jgi:subtilisin-like proprotein convertase family protein